MAFKIIHSEYYDFMEIWQKVFTLLAIRHNNSIKLKTFVLKKVYELLKITPTNSLLLRFLQATIYGY